MRGRSDLVASAAYQPEPSAAAAARRFVRQTLQSWDIAARTWDPDRLVDDAVLLTSELVTNAVVHAGTPLDVTCRLTSGELEVAVRDRHPARTLPDIQTASTSAERGRGLLLPSALASSWGVTYARIAKAVWFRMSLARDEETPGDVAGLPPVATAANGTDQGSAQGGGPGAALAPGRATGTGAAPGEDAAGARPPGTGTPETVSAGDAPGAATLAGPAALAAAGRDGAEAGYVAGPPRPVRSRWPVPAPRIPDASRPARSGWCPGRPRSRVRCRGTIGARP